MKRLPWHYGQGTDDEQPTRTEAHDDPLMDGDRDLAAFRSKPADEQAKTVAWFEAIRARVRNT